jgi:hypothetical protein
MVLVRQSENGVLVKGPQTIYQRCDFMAASLEESALYDCHNLLFTYSFCICQEDFYSIQGCRPTSKTLGL